MGDDRGKQAKLVEHNSQLQRTQEDEFHSGQRSKRAGGPNSPMRTWAQMAPPKKPGCDGYGPITQVKTMFSETGVIVGCPWLLSLSNCATLPLLRQKSLASSIALWI